MKALDLINKNDILGKLSLDLLNNLLKNGSFITQEYKPDCMIHFEGDPCVSLDIILDGIIAVERYDKDGNVFTVNEFSLHDIVGGNLLFSDSPFYPLSVRAKTKLTTLTIKKEDLLPLLCENPEFLSAFLKRISNHAVSLGEKVHYLVGKSIRDKIIDYLRTERKKQKSQTIYMTLSKKELAERLGIQRTSLSRELAKMRDGGIITFDAKSITIISTSI
ncbi:CRP-like cAMP-binding protein [Aequitasia blattaphilus]|uniref:Crp/Fnr family transcriptional regulator n=1 Tax=Aequitasia blattaphilus TaxID=2949332 RepID=A0ABT1EC82_9FIRM|nr:Crp/Fnr family transcriptional regulator [Aequitasia blattaphilus]MCP1103445.1 Crp/Fnr family transcriptional regulator [Aequitasia blattaphilus]MCR8616085.1 Crp/Fnr family transcriptional regulator [Aequitasia blattaphilus]